MNLQVKGIYKSFGAGNILNGIDFSVSNGEICALLGENGAGKTTLMNIIGGICPADKGKILIDGKEVAFRSSSDSMAAGIAFIHQESDLINDLTVYENIFLSGFKKKGIFLDKKEMISCSEKLFERFDIDLDPRTYVRDLDSSYKQLVAISRALSQNASLIIMDEPTSSISTSEIDRLFTIMRNLKESGISIIFISHKLNEVIKICDTYTVIRNGEVADAGKISDTDAEHIAVAMVGRELSTDRSHFNENSGHTVLEIKDLSDGKNFFNVSFNVQKGDVLGISGLLGDGRSELFETVFGIHGSDYTGFVIINGKSVHPSTPYEAIRYGMAYVPKNRQENAIVPDMSIIDNAVNVISKDNEKNIFLKKEEQKKTFIEKGEDLNIKYSDPDDKITTLSGGNQQKVIFSKWLQSTPEILILDNPTQGVDVGAKEEIYRIIEDLSKKGIAVIVLSSEAQEIIRVCKRCIVMFHGHTVGEISGENMTEETIMKLATGSGKAGKDE